MVSSEIATNWRYPGDYTSSDYDENLLWNEAVVLYDQKVESFKQDCRMLINGCDVALTESNRQQWAQEETVFFVKTHELPFERYFEGEAVIHIVRNPVAVFRSYYFFVKVVEQVPESRTK